MQINDFNSTGGATDNYVSFELYAAIQGGTKPFYNQAFNGLNITVQQSGTAQLTPDLADLGRLVVFIQLISARGLSTPGAIVSGNNIGQLVGNGATDINSNIVCALGRGYVYPSSANASTHNLTTMGPAWSSQYVPQQTCRLAVQPLGLSRLQIFFTSTPVRCRRAQRRCKPSPIR